MFSTKLFVVLLSCLVCVSALLFDTIYNMQETVRRKRCQLLTSSQFNKQYDYHCKVTRVSVIGLDVGGGLRRVPNPFSYNGPVLRTSDVTFMTEQNGYGRITATFNGAILTACSGAWPGMKRKTCVIPRSLRPWSGRITVKVSGGPSTAYYMHGTPLCLRAGYEGDNCDRDIDECQRYKGKRICAWAKGCVNTLGSYRCTCPPGYKVSSKDFRLCEIDLPKITSPNSKVTVMYGSSVTLPCQHQSSGPVTVTWQFENKVIAVALKQANGTTLQKDGDLVVNKVTYGDAGKFVCLVGNGLIAAYVTHTVQVESAPMVDFQHLVSGNYTAQHAYKVGDNVTIDCQVLSMPKSTITVKKDGQVLQSTSHLKVTQSKIADLPIDIEGALQVRIDITQVQTAAAGTFTCSATNKHGSISKTIALTVTK